MPKIFGLNNLNIPLNLAKNHWSMWLKNKYVRIYCMIDVSLLSPEDKSFWGMSIWCKLDQFKVEWRFTSSLKYESNRNFEWTVDPDKGSLLFFFFCNIKLASSRTDFWEWCSWKHENLILRLVQRVCVVRVFWRKGRRENFEIFLFCYFKTCLSRVLAKTTYGKDVRISSRYLTSLSKNCQDRFRGSVQGFKVFCMYPEVKIWRKVFVKIEIVAGAWRRNYSEGKGGKNTENTTSN